MISKSLDDKIILYSNNLKKDYLSYIDFINKKMIEGNVWQISSKNNIKDTDLTINSEILYLSSVDKFLKDLSYNFLNNIDAEKTKLRIWLNDNSLDCILEYIKTFELNIQSIKDWSICKNIANETFHHDQSRNETNHSYTIIFALNDNYTGGQIQFENRIGNDLISMSAGEILIYPSNENYRHKELPVTNGTKYTAIAYF